MCASRTNAKKKLTTEQAILSNGDKVLFDQSIRTKIYSLFTGIFFTINQNELSHYTTVPLQNNMKINKI